MDDEDLCQCPGCREQRDKLQPQGDFLEAARLAAARAFPTFKLNAEALYSPEWTESVITRATFVMLAAAALFHEATAAMAGESKRPPDFKAMMLGVKAYGMTFGIVMDIDASQMEFVAEEAAKTETHH